MARGTGPEVIVPGGHGIWNALTGQSIYDTEFPQNPNQWFGHNVMGSGGQWLDFLRAGGGTSYGPQSTTYQRSGFPLGDPGGAGLQGALFGSSYSPQFGQSAYQRFADSGNSYLRRYGTDVRVDPNNPNVALQPELDAKGNPVGFGQGVSPNPAYYSQNAKTLLLSPERSAGLRSGQSYGGRDATGAPIGGVQSDIFKTSAGLAQLQQGANPWLNDPATAANMQIYSELSSPFTRGNPQDYLRTAQSAEIGPTTAAVAGGYGDLINRAGQAGVSQMGGVTNAYEQDLLNQMARQGSKDLSLGLQDAQGTLSAMGLGRSGQGQSTAAGVWKDIQEKNALDRQNIMAQFAEANAGRNAQAILAAQQGGIGGASYAQQAAAQANEARLARMNAAAMGGQQALTGSLEASRAAQRGGLQQGMQNTLAWNQGVQGNLNQAMLGGDQAMLNRMIAEQSGQSTGLHDYAMLQQLKDAQYFQNQQNMLDLEDRYMAQQNAAFNQTQQGAMYGPNAMMQMITGIAPQGIAPARTSPWALMAGQAGLNYGGNLIAALGKSGGGNLSALVDDKTLGY